MTLNSGNNKTMKNINSKIIGKLTQDEQLDTFWVSQAQAIPFFEGIKLPVTYISNASETIEVFIEDADKAIQNFLQFVTNDRLNITEYAYENCKEFVEAVNEDWLNKLLEQLVDKKSIWNHIEPTQIYVERRYYHDKDVYVSIACECEWEQEHGLQFVFRQGKKLTRVSTQDGHLTEADAWGISDSEDKLLSAF